MNTTIVLLTRIIQYGLYLILLTPLLLWWGVEYPFLTPKVLAFQTLVEIVFGAWLALLLIGVRSDRTPEQESQPFPCSLISLSLGLYLVYSLLSALFSQDFKLSLWGVPDRQDGLVLLAHFLCWLIVTEWYFGNMALRLDLGSAKPASKSSAVASFRIGSDIHDYVRFSYVVSVLVALSAFYQWLSLTAGSHLKLPTLLPNTLDTTFGARVSGVFGNSTFVGPYFIFHLFLGVSYWRSFLIADQHDPPVTPVKKKQAAPSVRNKTSRSMILFVTVAQILLVVVTLLGKTRGPILSLMASGFFLALFLIFSKSVKPVTRAVLIFLVIFGFLGAFAVWQLRDSELFKRFGLVQRLTQVSLAEFSVGSRLMVWQSAWKGVRDHPLIGVGHNNAYFVLNKYYNPKHVRYEYVPLAGSAVTWFDKTHNALLDILVEKGILGIVLLIPIIVALWRVFWGMKDWFLAVCLACGFAAYGISNLVAFDSFGSLFGCYLSMSLLAVQNPVRKSAQQSSPTTTRVKSGGLKTSALGRLGVARKFGLTFVVLAVIFGIYSNAQTALAMTAYAEAQRTIPKDLTRGIYLYENALSYISPYKTKMELRLALTAAEAVINQAALPNREYYLDLAVKSARRAYEEHPNDVATCISLCDLFNNLAYLDKKYASDAQRYGLKALELSPNRQEALFYLARTYLILDQPSRALTLTRQLVDDNPEMALGHWCLVLALLANDRGEEAKEEVRRAIRMGYRLRNLEESEMVRNLLGEQAFMELMNSKHQFTIGNNKAPATYKE